MREKTRVWQKKSGERDNSQVAHNKKAYGKYEEDDPQPGFEVGRQTVGSFMLDETAERAFTVFEFSNFADRAELVHDVCPLVKSAELYW